MKIGQKVLVFEDYYDDTYQTVMTAPAGTVLTVNKFSKKDWKYNRTLRDKREKTHWYVSFNEIEGCFYFPNDYMKLHIREKNLRILLNEQA